MKPTLPMYICLLVLISGGVIFSQQPGEKQIHRLSLPNRNWSLDVSLEGFTVTNEEVKTAESAYAFDAWRSPEKKAPRMANLRIQMGLSQVKGTAAELRDFAMKRLKKEDMVDKNSLKAFEYAQIPLVRYRLDLAGAGLPDLMDGASKAIEAYFVKDDVRITIAFLSTPFKKDDERLFYVILDSIKIIDNSAPSNSFDYYQLGRSLFLQREYRKAIESLSEALRLEQQKKQLGKSEWRKLVLQLANAYGAVGNRSASEEVLEYGLIHDPTYYSFHFTRARLYASEDKLDETIASLEKAFLYQRNETTAQIVEPLPNPLFDRAFEGFRKNEKFRKAVKAMKK